MGQRADLLGQRKEQVADALLTLMEQKPLEQIQVKEIAVLAGIGRASYFRYFSSMEEVLGFKLDRMWMQWVDEHPRPRGVNESRRRVEWFFSFFASEPVLPVFSLIYQRMTPAQMLTVFLKAGLLVVQMKGNLPRYTLTCAAYSKYAVLMEWARCGFVETPAELAQMYAEVQAELAAKVRGVV